MRHHERGGATALREIVDVAPPDRSVPSIISVLLSGAPEKLCEPDHRQINHIAIGPETA
jgi:hypothetical protein